MATSMKRISEDRSTPSRSSPPELAERIRARFKAADHVRRGVCLLNAERFDEAMAEFNAAGQINSPHLSLASYLAACLLGKGDPSGADVEFAKAELEEPGQSVHAIRRAYARHAAGLTEAAMDALREAISENTEDADLHFHLGLLLTEVNRFDEAELRFTQVVSIARDHTEAMVNLAMCCGVRSAPGDAVQHLLRAQFIRPNDPKIGLLLAQAIKAARQQGISVRARAAMVPDDDSFDSEGIQELATVIEAEPDFVDAFLSIPAGAVNDRVYSLLVQTLQVALSRQPEQAELHYHCGRLLDRLGRREDAIVENELAVQIDPNCIRALIELAKLYQQTDRAADATIRLEQAVKAGAEYADVYYLLGNLYRDQGNVIKARSAYRRALLLNQRYEAAQQALSALPL